MPTVSLAFHLSGGAWIFLAFLIAGFLAVAFAYYSRSGSDIAMRSFGDRGDRDPGAMNDRSQAVRDWSRGTGGQHRRNLPAARTDLGDVERLDPETHAAMRAWRTRMGSAMPSGLVAPVDPRRDHVRGPDDARVTVVAYSDFQCPACRSADETLQELAAQGDVRYVFRHFPLADAHDMALDAALATEWAASHGRFWEFHDALYAAKHVPSHDGMRRLAQKLGLDPGELDAVLTERRGRERVAADFDSGVRSGVNGTPTLFVDGVRHDDDFDPATVRKAVAAATS